MSFIFRLTALFVFIIAMLVNTASAAIVRVDVEGVLNQLVLGTFSSNAFSASFTYETDISFASSMTMDAPNDVGYIFSGMPYSGSAVVGNPLSPTYDVNYQGIEVGIGNNISVAMDDFPGVPAGIYDSFGLLATSPGAVLDGDGALSTGIQVGLLFFTATGFFSGVDSIPSDPPFGAGDIGEFFVFDFTNDNPNRVGVGDITSLTVTAVPLPAAFWLFASCLIGLFGFRHKPQI